MKDKPVSKGKQSLNKLTEHGASLSNIDVSSQNLRDFANVARKYKIDFAVKRDNTEVPPKYFVFFKAKDTQTVNKAFKEYVFKQTHKKPSVIESLSKNIEKAKNKELNREKEKDRGIQR